MIELKSNVIAILSLIIILCSITYSAHASEFPKAEIVNLEHPKKAHPGQEITIEVTIDHWIGSSAAAMLVCIQDAENRIGPVRDVPPPVPIVLVKRKMWGGTLEERPSTSVYTMYHKIPLHAKEKVTLVAETYLLMDEPPSACPRYNYYLFDSQQLEIVIIPESSPTEETQATKSPTPTPTVPPSPVPTITPSQPIETTVPEGIKSPETPLLSNTVNLLLFLALTLMIMALVFVLKK